MSLTTSGGQNAGGIQPETADFYSRLSAVGSISAAELAAVDQWAVIGKRDGWLAKGKDIGLFVGSNLGAALVKYKYTVAGTASFTNHNFVEADYVPTRGLSSGASSGSASVTNTNKYLETGFDAAANGLAYNNLSVACVLTSDVSEGFTPPFANYRSTTNPSFAAGDSLYIGSVSTNVASGSNLPRIISSNGTAYRGWIGGVKVKDGAAVSSTTIDGPVRLFMTSVGSVDRYGSYQIGFYFIGAGLTDAEALSLNDATDALMQALGRVPRKPAAVFLGDSITYGQGTSGSGWNTLTTPKRWARIVADKLQFREINTGVQSSQLRQDVTAAIGGYTRRADVTRIPPHFAFVVYGTNDLGSSGDNSTNGDPTKIADFQTKLTTLLGDFKAARISVVVGGPPYQAAGISQTKIDAYNAAAAAACAAQGVPFVDLFQAGADDLDPASLLADTIHPSNAGHAVIGGAMAEGARGRFYRRPTLDFGSVAAQSSAELTVILLGARAGDSVTVTPPATLEAGLACNARVSANDTITVRLTNATAGAIDPAPGRYVITLTK